MRIAFKEWAIVVDALGRGEQIIIFRKGGISEGRSGFQVEHPEFLLFPTLFHQQRESVLDEAQRRFDAIAPEFPDPSRLRIEFCARIEAWQRLGSLADVERLRGQHVWREEVIAGRFDWGREKAIHALAVRVFRLPQKIERPMLPAFGGCKSWIDLGEDIPTEGVVPVLDEEPFAEKLRAFREAARFDETEDSTHSLSAGTSASGPPSPVRL